MKAGDRVRIEMPGNRLHGAEAVMREVSDGIGDGMVRLSLLAPEEVYGHEVWLDAQNIRGTVPAANSEGGSQ